MRKHNGTGGSVALGPAFNSKKAAAVARQRVLALYSPVEMDPTDDSGFYSPRAASVMSLGQTPVSTTPKKLSALRDVKTPMRENAWFSNRSTSKSVSARNDIAYIPP